MDQLANMLTMMKNAGTARKEYIVVPHSKIKAAICALLKKEGYIAGFEQKTQKGHPVLEIAIAYDAHGGAKIKEVARVSKQSRRMYAGVRDLKPFKSGFGHYVLSTPKGIMLDRDAKKEMVGGELLFRIW